MLAHPAELPALDEIAMPARDWLARMRSPHETDAAFLIRRFESLPIIQKLGGAVDTRLFAIRPYSEWAEDLRSAVEDG